MSNNVLVFIEQRAGKILPASFQLLTPAATLAQALGGQVDACIVGHHVGELAGLGVVDLVDQPGEVAVTEEPHDTLLIIDDDRRAGT